MWKISCPHQADDAKSKASCRAHSSAQSPTLSPLPRCLKCCSNINIAVVDDPGNVRSVLIERGFAKSSAILVKQK